MVRMRGKHSKSSVRCQHPMSGVLAVRIAVICLYLFQTSSGHVHHQSWKSPQSRDITVWALEALIWWLLFLWPVTLVSSGFDSYTAIVWDVILLTEVTEQLTCVLNSLLQPLCFADVWPWASQCTIVPSWSLVKGVDCALGQLCPGGSSPLLKIKGSSHTCFANTAPFLAQYL